MMTNQQRLNRLLPLGLLALFALLSLPLSANAQGGPDIRELRPHVILLLDSSGSMERRSDCTCTTDACTECTPICNNATSTYERSRWTVLVEALTGEYTNFECRIQNRNGPTYTGKYDQGYVPDHVQLPGEFITSPPQSQNGILDYYIDRIKFGMMTADGIGTLATGQREVTRNDYEQPAFHDETITNLGLFSYGDDKVWTFPAGAPTEYMANSGARNESASNGGLVSVGGDGTHQATNSTIQTSLTGSLSAGIEAARPYGGSPLSALMDDVDFYFSNNNDVIRKTSPGGSGDPFYECRPKAAVLITDGLANAEYRGDPWFCENEAAGGACPYDTPENVAAQLVANHTTGDADFKLFVVGFNLGASSVETEAALNDIAAMGGTDEAYFAGDREELKQALGQILDDVQPGTTTRTIPRTTTLFSADPSRTEYQVRFLTGFHPSFDADDRGTACSNDVASSASTTNRPNRTLKTKIGFKFNSTNRTPIRTTSFRSPRIRASISMEAASDETFGQSSPQTSPIWTSTSRATAPTKSQPHTNLMASISRIVPWKRTFHLPQSTIRSLRHTLALSTTRNATRLWITFYGRAGSVVTT
ncbi:MAG: hypothetical protein R3A47_10145 [Polyangiales bacterium]